MVDVCGLLEQGVVGVVGGYVELFQRVVSQ